jgi:hypothetical protein
MYTVARIAYSPETPIDVSRQVEIMAAQTPWAPFEVRDKKQDGYAASISSDDDWHVHVTAAVDFLTTNLEALRTATAAGADLKLDTAFGPEDHPRHGTWYRELELGDQLLTLLASAGMTYAFTVYPGTFHPSDGLPRDPGGQLGEDDYPRWADDTAVLAEVGRALFSQRTRVAVRIPAHLADAAVAAWERDDIDTDLPDVETSEQARVRDGAGHLALIGLAISERGRRDGDEVVIDVEAWDVGAAFEAADAVGGLDGIQPPPP